MKKSLISIVCGLIVFVIGAGLFASTYLEGATGFHSKYVNIGFDENGDFGAFTVGEPLIEDYATTIYEVAEEYGDNIASSMWTNGTESAMNINLPFDDIFLDISCADVTICAAKDESQFGSVHWEKIDGLEWSVDGDTLFLTVTDDHTSTGGKKLTVMLPQGTAINSISGSIGLGCADIRGVNIQDIDLSLDLGSITLKNIQQADSIWLYSALGNIELDEVNCSTLTATADLGNIDVDGRVGNGNFTLSMGNLDFEGTIGSFWVANEMGNVEMELTGPQEQHDLDISCDMGNIQVMGQKTTGSLVTTSPDALYTGTVQCSAGKIEIQFDED